MMVLQQPDGEAIRIPGGYGGGVASGVAASEPHSSPQFRDRLRERTPHYSPDKMNLAAATHQRSSTTAGRAANILPNDVGWSAVEETKQSEAEIRRERWAAEQKKLAQDMEALLQQHQPGRSSSHVASSSAVRARVYSEAERARRRCAFRRAPAGVPPCRSGGRRGRRSSVSRLPPAGGVFGERSTAGPTSSARRAIIR